MNKHIVKHIGSPGDKHIVKHIPGSLGHSVLFSVPRFPSKSGLIHKHIVKHIVSGLQKPIVKHFVNINRHKHYVAHKS
jgi:hypothetical protein